RLRSAGAALAVAAVVAVPALISHGTHTAQSQPMVPAAPASAGKAVNLLLLGTDAARHADTIAVVHVPPGYARAYVITVERDTAVVLDSGQSTKADAAYLLGGVAATEQAIGEVVGVDSFNGSAVVTYAGLAKLVEAAGGVDMCVDARTISVHIGHTKDGSFATPYRFTAKGLVHVPGVIPEVYEVGCHHFAGWQAVDYVRQRMLIAGTPDGNAARDSHARDLIAALVRQLTGDPVRLAAVLQVASQVLTLDTGGLSLIGWVRLLHGITAVRGLEFDPAQAPALRKALATEDLDTYLAAHPG
ncbi:MAG TPA: LCP family protein, partial [Rugosimonospora sp.]|nr:LCP family protein [Rugosimonospora sp.]